jgi:hypothetical protein
VPSAQLTLGESIDLSCALPIERVLTEVEVAQPPPTQWGSPHFLRGFLDGERLWVGGFQDGILSFDFPASGPLPNAGWQLYQPGAAYRLVRFGNHLLAGTRLGHLEHLTVNAAGKASPATNIAVPGVVWTEGLAATGDRVWVAGHDKGLVALAGAQLQPVAIQTPAAVSDAWDAHTLDADHLVVADGENGVHVLSVSGPNANAPVVVDSVALPGASANVRVVGDRVVVGQLDGGVHVLRWIPAGQAGPGGVVGPALALQASAPIDDLVHGVHIGGQLVFVAAGRTVRAYDLPGPDVSGAALAVRDVHASVDYAMDVLPTADGHLLVPEFASIRRYKVDPTAEPMIVLERPKAVVAPVTLVGGTLETMVWLRNPSAQPLVVEALRFVEGAGADDGVFVAGPIDVAPGALVEVPFSATKTKKGLTAHHIKLVAPGLDPELSIINLLEVTTHTPGDTLPTLVYQTADKQTLDINAHMAGKVGVVFAAAHTCPVAWEAIAAAAADLGPWVQAGQVAVAGIDPWDVPDGTPQAALPKPFPFTYSPLTTNDGHGWSEVLDLKLTQPQTGSPMPIVYVTDKKGVIRHAAQGYAPKRLHALIEKLLLEP